MIRVWCLALFRVAASASLAVRQDRVLLHFGHLAKPAGVGTLGEAADRIEAALAGRRSTDILVELASGPHRVPAEGLRLSALHTPSSVQHTVTWRCADGPGSCSVHGGEAVRSGWQLCTSGCATKGTMIASVPAALKGKTLRHLYVNGERAYRTRSQPSALFGSPPHYGLRFFGPSAAQETQAIQTGCEFRTQPLVQMQFTHPQHTFNNLR